MLRGICQVQLRAQDLPRLAQFYRDVLGLNRLPTPEGVSADYWQCFSVGGVELALIARPRHESTAVQQPGSGPVVVFRVRDMEAAREVLSARGVELSSVRAALPGVQVCELRDPEGNLLLLEARD